MHGWSLLRLNYIGSFGDRLAKVIQLLGMILPKVQELRKVIRTYFLVHFPKHTSEQGVISSEWKGKLMHGQFFAEKYVNIIRSVIYLGESLLPVISLI
jgi:hypothetical protein